MTNFSFDLLKTDKTTGARRGTMQTAHGTVQTPLFMPVGTRATVKGVKTDALDTLGAQVVLSNTYHLYLRPGAELVAEAGGLHKFVQLLMALGIIGHPKKICVFSSCWVPTLLCS